MQRVIWAIGLICVGLAAQADERMRAISGALEIAQIVEIMQQEGEVYSEQLAEEMLPAGVTSSWVSAVKRLYDPNAMQQRFEAQFEVALPEERRDAILAVLTRPDIREITALEIAARRALLDPALEQELTEPKTRKSLASPVLMAQIEAMIKGGDLITENTSSALNSNIRFYQGLVDGGAYALSAEEIIKDVNSQRAEIAADAEGWLYAFFSLAYTPLEPELVDRHVAFMNGPDGLALMAALFTAFDGMYGDISYGLGLAVARELTAQEL